ncbi:hypothetical protein Taro_046304 [Colocasia esculenta]|uniref:LOB domain-containing protein n=1 Tax=Colocasia esculenta TaxID=4460 RepID=A0A843WTF8_COLES|nr:hypothetical protein [Colocasia esculenta]
MGLTSTLGRYHIWGVVFLCAWVLLPHTASRTGFPCGACKYLRRKCAVGCVFAPYFCSEQGSEWFAAVHRVFGASNASKLLMHVPPADRCEAAVTMAYEAQTRLKDPVYGCVAHIFALQHQVGAEQPSSIAWRGGLPSLGAEQQSAEQQNIYGIPPQKVYVVGEDGILKELELVRFQYLGGPVATLQVQLMQARAELIAHKTANRSSSSLEKEDPQGNNVRTPPSQSYPHGQPFSPQSSLDCIDYMADAILSTEEAIYLDEDIHMDPCPKNRRQQSDMGELQDLALRMIRN